MYLNDNAITYSKTGAHRLISKEEAYEVLRRAEDNGLVHEINQTPGFEESSAILLRLLLLCPARCRDVPCKERHPLKLRREDR